MEYSPLLIKYVRLEYLVAQNHSRPGACIRNSHNKSIQITLKFVAFQQIPRLFNTVLLP